MTTEDTSTDSVAEVTEDNGTIQFDEPLETDETLDLQANCRSVLTDQGDPEIESLYQKHKRGRLNVQPDFQRQFVWDQTKSSRLIESALLRIPLPVIYLSQDDDGTEQVIDGQQRLTAFFAFMDGSFPNGVDFRLKNLKVFTELNGKKFTDLDESSQDRIRFCKIRAITFLPESDSELKFEVFERLNTGAVSLNDQELRNCMFRGPYNDLLKKLSQNNGFCTLLDLKRPDKRMKDVELVLRFAAFYHATYLKYRSPMRKFLNADMKQYKQISPENARELEDAFKTTVSLIRSLLDKHAFKRFYRGTANGPDGYWEKKKFNSSLYDVLMWSFARVDKNLVMGHLDAIREAFIDLMANNDAFIDSIQLSTSSVQAVQARFRMWDDRLRDILGDSLPQPRCFSKALKHKIFDTNPTCEICANRIQGIDDAALDHVQQYWRGGQTIPENARLTHRYCNLVRSRKD